MAYENNSVSKNCFAPTTHQKFKCGGDKWKSLSFQVRGKKRWVGCVAQVRSNELFFAVGQEYGSEPWILMNPHDVCIECAPTHSQSLLPFVPIDYTIEIVGPSMHGFVHAIHAVMQKHRSTWCLHGNCRQTIGLICNLRWTVRMILNKNHVDSWGSMPVRVQVMHICLQQPDKGTRTKPITEYQVKTWPGQERKHRNWNRADRAGTPRQGHSQSRNSTAKHLYCWCSFWEWKSLLM